MARYTVELGDVAKSGLKIFNFDYEFYDEEKKADFEQKFLNHFRFREIGQETVGRFQHYLKVKCDETLPYYNMLFRTALVDYEKTINYSLTETFTRTNTNSKELTGTANQDGTTADTTHNNGTITRDSDITNTKNNTNIISSNITHVDNTTTSKHDTTTETGTLDNTTTVDTDNKRVGSDTPNGLLSMTNIKNNVYASKADIEDNISITDGSQTSNVNKTGDETETLEKNVTDINHTTTTDNTTDTNSENTTDTTNNTVTANGTIHNTATTNQNESENGEENYTKVLRGSYGVITEADMLQKHINLQKTLSKILIDFFDECEDLFMGVY